MILTTFLQYVSIVTQCQNHHLVNLFIMHQNSDFATIVERNCSLNPIDSLTNLQMAQLFPQVFAVALAVALQSRPFSVERAQFLVARSLLSSVQSLRYPTRREYDR